MIQIQTLDYRRYGYRQPNTGVSEHNRSQFIPEFHTTDIGSLPATNETYGFMMQKVVRRTCLVATPGGSALRVFDDTAILKTRTDEKPFSPYAHTAIAILKSSGKFRFMKADALFDVNKIGQGITLEEFKHFRKKADIPIEDYLFRERYE